MSSLQNAIHEWRADYDETRINEYDPDYIGSIRATNGNFYSGTDIYIPGSNQIYTFNVYAGQGVDHNNTSEGGGKFAVYSYEGFSWNTIDANNNGQYEFVTSGNLDFLMLGHSAPNDNGAAPSADTLGAFNLDHPLLFVMGFDIAVNYAASLFGVADGNSAIDVSATASDGTTLSSILANSFLYETATLNSTVLYSLAFDNTGVQAFEWVLDKYLESKGSDITDSFDDIANALEGTGVYISYFDGGFFGGLNDDFAPFVAEVQDDLLLAA